MNKIILRYLLIFIAIGAFLFFLFRGRTPFGKANTSFAVKPETEITRIDLLQKDNRLSLKKSGDKWLINKGDEARKNGVLFLLRTLHEIKIKSPVSSEIFENEIVKKQVEPVKVNVYAGMKLVKSFFVYKTGSNIYGNIMKMKASSKPFIVYIPGYEDNVGTHFATNELFWKPFSLFNLLPSQIAYIKLENFSEESSSFIINCNNKSVSLSDLKNSISGWDTLKVKRYLSYFTAISFENWAFDLPGSEKKEIEGSMPLYRITVKQVDGKEVNLTIYEKWNIADGTKKKDTDRIWGKTNLRDDLFIIRYFDLDPILKKRSYFFAGQ
jgi:hypothetical protein